MKIGHLSNMFEAKKDEKKEESDENLLKAFKKLAKLMGLKPEGVRALASKADLSDKEKRELEKFYRDQGYH